jgi:hypothetical protein
MQPDDLIAYWSALGDRRVHPEDSSTLPSGRFATDLLPLPWNGPLSIARACILLINPGLNAEDYSYEKRPEFRDALTRNLAGNGPYLYLQQRFADHPGSIWARHLFGSGISEAHADSICVVQLVAYHFADGGHAKQAARRLPSSQQAVRFAHEWLLPRAQSGRIALIVGRATKQWRISSSDESPAIVVYQGWECRGALQTPGARGGQLLRKVIANDAPPGA